jgi:hypothetical protein
MKRRNRYPGRNPGAGFGIFIIVIVLAVAAGYAGTKYIIYPHLLGSHAEAEDQAGDNAAGEQSVADVVLPGVPDIVVGQRSLEDETPDTVDPSTPMEPAAPVAERGGPYCVQFGSFSEKGGAEALSAELSGHGIYSYVLESGGGYKVLGLPYEDEAKAGEAAGIVSAVVSDAFVVNLSKLMK